MQEETTVFSTQQACDILGIQTQLDQITTKVVNDCFDTICIQKNWETNPKLLNGEAQEFKNTENAKKFLLKIVQNRAKKLREVNFNASFIEAAENYPKAFEEKIYLFLRQRPDLQSEWEKLQTQLNQKATELRLILTQNEQFTSPIKNIEQTLTDYIHDRNPLKIKAVNFFSFFLDTEESLKILALTQDIARTEKQKISSMKDEYSEMTSNQRGILFQYLHAQAIIQEKQRKILSAKILENYKNLAAINSLSIEKSQYLLSIMTENDRKTAETIIFNKYDKIIIGATEIILTQHENPNWQKIGNFGEQIQTQPAKNKFQEQLLTEKNNTPHIVTGILKLMQQKDITTTKKLIQHGIALENIQKIGNQTQKQLRFFGKRTVSKLLIEKDPNYKPTKTFGIF